MCKALLTHIPSVVTVSLESPFNFFSEGLSILYITMDSKEISQNMEIKENMEIEAVFGKLRKIGKLRL